MRRWHFTVQLQYFFSCVQTYVFVDQETSGFTAWIDIDHSKFQPHSVSHRGAVRGAHRHHRLVLQTIFL